MSFHHIPVLLNEVLEYLNPQPGEVYADGTLGGYGAGTDKKQWLLDHEASSTRS